MERFELRIKRSAVRELEAVGTKGDRQRLTRRIAALAEDPRPAASEKLTSQERYRIRQGVYRVVYSVDDDAKVVTVVKIGHRQDVYR